MATSVSLGYCAWLAGSTWSDVVGRNQVAGLSFQGASRGGVLPNVGNPLQVLATSGLSFSIAPGAAVVPSSSGVTFGPYMPVNNVTQTLTHNTADPTNPRIDLVSIQVTDNGNSTSFGQIVITAGTPAASPVAPAAPSNSITLSQNRINAGMTTLTQGLITDSRIYCAAPGGIIICPNMASLPVGYPGLVGYDVVNNRLFSLTSTGAGPLRVLGFPPALAIRTSNLTVSSTSETSILTVNFTADGVSDYEIVGRFADAFNPNAVDQLHFRLYIDATLIQDNQCYTGPSISSNFHYGAQNVIHVTSSLKGTTPTAGAHTAKLAGLAVNQNTTVVGAGFQPIELSVKQASM